MRPGARRGQAGSATLQTVLVMPLLLLLITLIVQFALWYHAAHIATAAAQDGARAARIEGGTAADGQARAQQVLEQLGVLTGSSVTVTRDANVARVEVHGYAPADPRAAAAAPRPARSIPCARLDVAVDTTEFGPGGNVVVDVTCTVKLSDLVGVGFGNDRDLHSHAIAVVDTFRGVSG